MDSDEIVAQLRASCEVEVNVYLAEMEKLSDPNNWQYRSENMELIRFRMKTLQQKIDEVRLKYMERLNEACRVSSDNSSGK